jgi:hypothetical protein
MRPVATLECPAGVTVKIEPGALQVSVKALE